MHNNYMENKFYKQGRKRGIESGKEIGLGLLCQESPFGRGEAFIKSERMIFLI